MIANSVEASEPEFSEARAEVESFDSKEREEGFQSSPEIRRVIEDYAMTLAKAKLSSVEFKFNNFKDTSREQCYDYTCERAAITRPVASITVSHQAGAMCFGRSQLFPHPKIAVTKLANSL